jgi:hypothetical protein
VLRIRIRDPVFFTPGFGIIFFLIPDPGSNPYLWELVTIFWVKQNSVSIDSNLFCTCLKITFFSTKNGQTTNVFFPCSFFVGSQIRDGKKNWIRNTGHNLALNLFPFPSLLKITRFLYNRRSAVVSFRASLIPSCLFYCTNTIGAAIFTPLTGEAWRKKNLRNFFTGAANSPCFANRCDECATLPLWAQCATQRCIF